MTTQTKPQQSAAQQPTPPRTFPDPSLTLVEFGDSLGVLIAARTERDAENRRIVLKKVPYVRFDPDGWGGTAYPEIHIEQKDEAIYHAIEPRTAKVLRYPSKARYAIDFISKELFDCALQCIKERNAKPLYELVAVTFSGQPDFTVESGCLVGPQDYAVERTAVAEEQLLPSPPRFK